MRPAGYFSIIQLSNSRVLLTNNTFFIIHAKPDLSILFHPLCFRQFADFAFLCYNILYHFHRKECFHDCK